VNEKFREYLLEYGYQGARWSATIQAISFEDAKARAQAMYWATVSGTVEATIPAGLGWFARAWCWMRNATIRQRKTGGRT
jgi:hypothetical protein